MPDVYGIILTGGSGTRLWPKSREDLPKQFLALASERTLLQDTLLRMLRIVPDKNLCAVSNDAYASRVKFQSQEVADIPESFIVTETCARNTAPAILLGCEALRERGACEDDFIVVTPSDHIVLDVEAFVSAIQYSFTAAAEGRIVTLGVIPDRPETGFGYIKRGISHDNWHEVSAFVEKPDLKTAEDYLKSGDYYWNAGIFIFTLSSLYRELKRLSSPLASIAGKGTEALLNIFSCLPSISFDYALMEKTRSAAVVPLNAGWSDVGSWDTLYDVLKHDEQNNCLTGDVMAQDCSGCLVYSQNKLTVISDIDDLILVDTPDTIFATKRGSSQKVRDVVQSLNKKGRKEVHQVTDGAEPWGTYKVLSEDEGSRIIRRVIYPEKSLLLTPCRTNGLYGVISRGFALLEDSGNERVLNEGDSFFIPADVWGVLTCPEHSGAELIEIHQGKENSSVSEHNNI